MSSVPVPEITLTCFQVSRAIAVPILANGEMVITGICTDSRLVEPGQLFFCLQGENFDGHDFIRQAINSGAVAVVVAESLVNLEVLTNTYPNVCFFPVTDTLQALGDLAAWWLKHLGGFLSFVRSFPSAGITPPYLAGMARRKNTGF